MTLKYVTSLQFSRAVGICRDIPSWDVGQTPTRETVGTGDGSATEFYLDHHRIVSGSYTIYYGTTAAATTTLTETTHYTLDKDTGKLTLTSAGVTLLSTNNIYAAYSYYDLDLSSTYVDEVLARAEQEVDSSLNTTFTDGTATNPSYPSATDVQSSQGFWDRQYFTQHKPLVDVSSTLDGDITATATTLDVASGDGAKFPSSGTIIIGNEIISYTGVSTDTLTGLTRGVSDSDGAAHSDGDSIHTTVLEISGTNQGSSPSWNALAWDSEMYAGSYGNLYIYKDQLSSGVYVNPALMREQDVAQRVRIRYLYGYDSVPVDITRLTILYAKRMLMMDNVSSSVIKGRNEFQFSALNADAEEMERIASAYRVIKIQNT